MTIRRLHATRYVTPLREGGSLPAVLETEGGGLFVAKFRGAGQGAKALVAELIAGELARAAGLRVPELALLELDADLGRTERDEEIRDLLRASAGINVGLSFLSSALMFDPAADVSLDPDIASMVVVVDAFVMNVDRSARNPNLLWWEDELWLIDHGAAFLWHHDWDGGLDGADRPFGLTAQHVLLSEASALAEAGRRLAERLDDATLEGIVADVPDELLPEGEGDRWREAYRRYLSARRDAAPIFVAEAERARGV